MAKKRSMNVFEAHVEKIALAVAAVLLAAVLLLGLLRPAGLRDPDGRSVDAETAAYKARTIADSIRSTMDEPGQQAKVSPYSPVADRFGRVASLPENPLVDRMPLTPIYLAQGPKPLEKRQYTLPEIPQLTDARMGLTQASAQVTLRASDSQDVDVRSPTAKDSWQVIDVDFVTVEATIPLGQCRQNFAQCFTDALVETPLEEGQPIVAVVDLQRSQLDNGSWTEFESVARLDKGERQPLLGPLTAAEIEQLGQAAYEFLVSERTARPQIQRSLLRPSPYRLQGWNWLPPGQQQEQAEAEKTRRLERQRAEAARTRPGRPATRSPALRRPAAGRARPDRFPPAVAAPRMPPAGIREGSPDIPPPGMMPEMPFPPDGQVPRFPQTGPLPRSGAGDRRLADWLNEDDVTFWAHDGQVKLGAVYRYRLRLGFFNPIAGRGWVHRDQAEFDDQRVLWSPWVLPEKFVRVPQRTWFFPTAPRPDTDSVSVDVCHKQNGWWYKKSFVLTPGSAIGEIVRMPWQASSRPRTGRRRADATDVDLVEIDFRTFATVVDIVANSRYYYQRGGQGTVAQTPVETADMLYRTAEGDIKRLAADKNCWPAETAQAQRRILKIIKAQDKSLREKRSATR